MSAKQLEKYSSDSSLGNEKCTNLGLGDITEYNAPGLTLPCIAAFLGADTEPKTEISLNQRVVEALKDDILSKVTNYQTSLAKIKPDAWKHFRAKQLNHLFANDKTCSSIPPRVVVDHPDIVVKGSCFAAMEGKTQSEVLKHIKTADADFLAHLKKTKAIDEWSVTVGENTLSGIAAVEILSHNIPDEFETIVRKMGTKGGEPHPCKGFGDIDSFKHAKNFQEAMDERCFVAMDHGKIAYTANAAELNKRLYGMRPWNILATETKDWGKVEDESFGRLVQGRVFCDSATVKDHISKIPSALFKHMDAECLARIRDYTGIPEDVVKAMPPAAFAKLSATKARQLPLASLSEAQYAMISAKLDNPKESLAATYTKEDVTALEDRIKAIELWDVVPPDAFGGVTAKQLPLIPAIKMVGWDRERVTKIPAEVRRLFSLEQMKKVGLNFPAKTDQCPFPKAFEDLLSDFSSEIQDEFHRRNQGILVSASLLVMLAVTAASVVAALW